MEDFQTAYSRRLIRVCRGIAGVLLVGCFTVMTGLVDVQVYKNEVDYAERTMEKDKFKPHRCNDRLADMLEVIEAEDGNIMRDVRPAFRNWWACMRSAEGAEPAMPYLMLTAKDKQYIDPASRATKADAVQQLST
ncbi:hypothetical protein PLESTB_001286700 [Pleodorina starrii]|uniref:Uncharacterized protein n=1 Tax=Pleodorina starrii TaxID=330485 RepID=A0A9W6F632_9CHLO|nr:hypothetical protein PLESTM_000831900 [Pleodorina starrii]GLC57897.1 hypothetical protein PLESTB_001286700 [Pleodorina starrii]GLC67112.1 hypothetical protein PLESTF_000516600 [Pleodorina starrii]